MYKKKNITSKIILWVFIVQIVLTNMFSSSAIHTESVSESVYENVSMRQILMEPAIESMLIGDVNGDGNRDSIDFALMRMVLLNLKSSFPVLNGEWASDTDGNGVFNSIDFAFMRRFLLGFISEFPAESNITTTITTTMTPMITPTITPTMTPMITPTITSTGSFDNEKPTVPGDFHYITKTESSVTLAWGKSTDNVGVVGYCIYLDNDECIASTNGNVFTVTGLEKKKSYGFSVKAIDQAGNYSDSSEYIVVTTMDIIETNKFIKVAAGFNHTLALKEDGTVWAWGNNWAGQLGNTSVGNFSSVPVRVTNLTDIKDISAGPNHSFALREDGTVWAWGNNSWHQCSAIEDFNIYVPVKVAGIEDVKQLAGDFSISCALKNNGTVWCWGLYDNKIVYIFSHHGYGRLGAGGYMIIK